MHAALARDRNADLRIAVDVIVLDAAVRLGHDAEAVGADAVELNGAVEGRNADLTAFDHVRLVELDTAEDAAAADTDRISDQALVLHLRIHQLDTGVVAPDLVRKAADLGLVAANISGEYGGLGLDQTSGALIAENLGRSASFAVTLGTQTGIGLLPLIHFGTEAAKQKYLPRIAAGELITAYALTEAGSGSDALAARATARLSEDGTHYILNGEKMFVTNGGFADIFVVFAKVDGRKFTAFIVEAQAGVARGAAPRRPAAGAGGLNGS